jgi:multiple sugar transport system permease protein
VQVVWNSCVWTLFVVLLQNVFGFLCALLLNQSLPGQGLMRSLILLPWVLPGVVAAILWRFMYDPQLGLINSILISSGILNQGQAWLAEGSTALAASILAAVWKGFPFSTIVYLAALQNVDAEQIEAATIDGAGPVRRLFDIILPAMREVIAINLVLTAILTFNYFDMIWVLTRGGPQNLTHIFPTKIYELGFGQFRFGEAASYGVMSILVLIVLIAAYFILQRPGDSARARA